MLRHLRSRRIGAAASFVLIATAPLLVGQGCPGSGGILPITPGQGADSLFGGGALDADSGRPIPGDLDTDNIAPFLQFTQPVSDIIREVGDVITLKWEDVDPDSSAIITLLVDPDDVFANGNEMVIEPMIYEDEDDAADFYSLDTRAVGLEPGVYRFIARVNDGISPEAIVVAPGRLHLFAPGFVPGNLSPAVVVLEPDWNLSVGQGGSVPIEWCASDPDDGEDGSGNVVLPDILVLFDLDDDPTNDLDLSAVDAGDLVREICSLDEFPQEIVVDGQTRAYIIGCVQDAEGGTLGECANAAANATAFPPAGDYVIDINDIPPRADGEPYHVRVTVWDHINQPVSGYAPGAVNVTALASGVSGVVDLREVGRTLTGSKFMGLNEGGLTGFTAAGIGDIDRDGAGDFAIVSRYGRGFDVGNFGTAHLVLGLPGGQQFGSEVPLNSISTTYRGSLFYMPDTTGTEGITSVCRMGDVTGDGRPDVLFGAPYVEVFSEDHIDGPCDCDPPVCHADLLPNPLGTGSMRGYDWREGTYVVEVDGEEYEYICSNDLDFYRETPIEGGYTFLVASDNLNTGSHNLASSVNAFIRLGSHPFPTITGPIGARFRGAWWNQFDFTQTELPYSITPYTRWGETINTMPPMHNTSLDVSPLYGTTQLVSAPDCEDGRGWVTIIPNNAFITFVDTFGLDPDPNSISFPVYHKIGNCPGCSRALVYPGFWVIAGRSPGDHLGGAGPAGDYNLDGSRDILCGAYGADRDGLSDNGVVYIIFGRPDFPSIDLETSNPPRMEIHGTASGDQFGKAQAVVGDINQDGLPDIGVASQYADSWAGADAGFIGIIFGGRPLTGENVFTVDQIGSPQLPGLRIYGAQAGGHAGAALDNAGDFNGDGIDDMLILAPDETRTVAGQVRRGVAYLLFGGYHLIDAEFSLSDVGSTVPGIVFVTPYGVGSADEAPISCAKPAGDVNNDGFDDILIGVSGADYVNPLEPSQRRIDAGECYLIYGNNTGSNSLW